MVKVETEIVINSSIENIWNILTDFNQYPLWNPSVQLSDEEKIFSERAKQRLKTQPGDPITGVDIAKEVH